MIAGRGWQEMPKITIGSLAFAALVLILCAGLSGCGPKPPCEGASVTQVQTAQDECAAATDELDAAREERAQLEADVSETRSELANLEGQPEQLARRLNDLKKGSGR